MKRRVIPFSKRRPEIRPQRSTKLSMEEEKSAHPNQQQRREETGSWAESSLRVTSKRNRNRRIIVVHHRICHRYWLRLKHKPGLLDGSAHRRVNRTHMFSYGLTNSLRLGREPSYALSRGRDLRRKLFQMRFHPAHPAVDIVEMEFKLKAIQLQPQQSFIQLVLRQRGGLRLHTVIIQRTGYSISTLSSTSGIGGDVRSGSSACSARSKDGEGSGDGIVELENFCEDGGFISAGGANAPSA